jgi:hypothetical protein
VAVYSNVLYLSDGLSVPPSAEQPMVTDFEDRLRQIRESKNRESEEQRRQDSALSAERHAELAARFDRRENLERVIGEYADKFVALVSTFTRQKSFFEGMYKIELHSDDLLLGDAGKVTKLFSRIVFLIDTHDTDGHMVVRCKKTVRNRDLESSMHALSRTEESFEAFSKFTEEQFLEFADAYFEGSAAPTPSVTT